MEKSRKVDLLNRALHGCVNSVVQYIEAATPYVPDGYEEQHDQVLRMKDEEVATATALTGLINDLDGVPKVGVFPYWNVDLNYLDLRFLCRFAAQHHEKTIAELEEEVDEVRDDPRVHAVLSAALEQQRAHVAALREIGGADDQPAAKEDEPAEKAE